MEWPIVAAYIFVFIGLVLLLHHGWKHFYEDEPSNARKESCVCVCYFQPKDVSHFETWSMISLTNSFWLGLDSTYDSAHGETCGVFAVLLCVLGALLMLISCAMHRDGKDSGYNFQNICNHETWILICISNACVLAFVVNG
jgi:hypothetical protein